MVALILFCEIFCCISAVSLLTEDGPSSSEPEPAHHPLSTLHQRLGDVSDHDAAAAAGAREAVAFLLEQLTEVTTEATEATSGVSELALPPPEALSVQFAQRPLIGESALALASGGDERLAFADWLAPWNDETDGDQLLVSLRPLFFKTYSSLDLIHFYSLRPTFLRFT